MFSGVSICSFKIEPGSGGAPSSGTVVVLRNFVITSVSGGRGRGLLVYPKVTLLSWPWSAPSSYHDNNKFRESARSCLTRWHCRRGHSADKKASLVDQNAEDQPV